MTIDFPLSPSNGENYMYNNIVYTFDGIKWVASAHLDNSGVIEGVTKAGDTMTGGLKIDDGAIDGIELNENGSASFTGKATSAETEEADVDGTLTTKQYIDDSTSALMTDVLALEPSFPPPWEIPWLPGDGQWAHYASEGPEERLNVIEHGNNKFVVLGSTTPLTIDDDLSGDWVPGPTLPYGSWEYMAVKDGRFVAISSNYYGPNYNSQIPNSNDTYDQIMYSDDGVNWTTVRQPSDNKSWHSIVASDTRFVMGGTRTLLWSYNGISWYQSSNIPTGLNTYHKMLAYGGGKFIVDTDYLYGQPPWYSSNGYTWTEGNPLPTGFDKFRYAGAVYVNGKWVVVGYNNGTGDTQIMTSTDAINWTEVEDTGDIRLGSISYFNGQFIIVAQDQSGYVAYSADGIRWTSEYAGLRASTWVDTAASNDRLVAVSKYTRNSNGTITIPARPIAATNPL